MLQSNIAGKGRARADGPCRSAGPGRTIRRAVAWAVCLASIAGAHAAPSVRASAQEQAAALVARM